MQYIPGSSVTLSASLHALQHQPLPDDTSLQTRLPQICVDYLSHDWLEEDVWKSWRNMTRHKNEVTNGVRLENASWRTWWKQRNKLRTISPETLNWLKDSDVTWLYGPLHTAADPVPPPKQSTTEERFNLVNASGKKPILKHRTITDLLNVPFDSFPAAGSPALEAIGMDFSGSSTTDDSANSSMPGSPRPPLPHTKSDSYITRRGRKDSPPTIPGGAPDHPGARSNSSSPRQYPPFLSNNARNNSGGSGNSHGSVSLAAPQPKKHISFNAFVQQCISIDKSASSDASSRYQTDSDIEDDTDFDSSNSSLIEMRRTPSFASGSSVSGGSIIRAPVSRSNSISSIHADKVTIAPIAPTVLKTSEELPAPSPAVRFVPPGDVDVSTLEYPPSTSSSPGSSGSSTPSETEDDDIAFLEGFVPPRWGRPSVPSGTVGTGAQGPAGPRDLFAEQAPSSPPQEFESPSTSPYRGERRHRHHHSSSPRSLGPMAGRSRWVGRVESDEDDESSGDGADADDSADDDGEFKRYRGHRRDEDGSMTASTTSDSTIVGNESSSSRRGILKTHPESEASSTPHSHSAPIGIPSTSTTHSSTSTVPPQGYLPTSTFTGGPFANSPQDTSLLSPTLVSSDGTSSSYQQPSGHFNSSLIQAPGGGRGRSSTRTSSSLSDRSRSSSKGAATGSPLGSVSPSGYGSPRSTGRPSRAATDVGLGGGVSAGGRGRSLGNRTGSLSPPFVGPNNKPGSPVPNGVIKEKEQKHTPTSNLSQAVKTAPPPPPQPQPRVAPPSPSTSPSSSTRKAAAAVPASNSATKKATPPPGPRPTVIISHKPSVHIQAATTTGSSTGTGVGSIIDRDRALEEAMIRRQKEAEQGKEDSEDSEEARKLDDRSTNPTPSNSPSMGFKMMARTNSSSSTVTVKASTPPVNNTTASHPPRIQGNPAPGPGKATVSVTSASATAGAVVDKASDMVISGAKGLLGAIWGGDGNVAR